jgi:capsular exopolysaccharide synthesis family protein
VPADTAVWKSLRKYWPTALAVTLAVLVATVFYTVGQTKIYEAQATVLLDPHPPRPLGRQVETVVDLGAGNTWNNQEYFETQYNIIRSMRVAIAVVGELGLQNDASFLQNLPPGKTPPKGERVEPEIAAEILRARVKVSPVRDSRLATISLRDADPQRAQRVLSTLIDVYVDQNLETALDSTTSASDWLRSQLDKLKTDLESSERELHKYKKENDILSVAYDDQSNMLREEMKDISTELTRVRALLQEATARSSVLSTVPEDDPTSIASSELHKSALLNSLRQEYETAKRRRDSLISSGKGTNHPQVAAASKQVEVAKTAVLKEIKNIKRSVGRDVAVLQRQAGGLAGMLDKARQRAHELNLLEIEYNKLRRAKENTEKLYSLVLERTKESDLTRMLRVNNIRVIDRPLLPRGPIHPRIPLNIAVGLFLGLVLGSVAAFARGLLDRTIKVPDDLERELGVSFLGLLPELTEASASPGYYRHKRKRHRGRRAPATDSPPQLIVHEQPSSSIAEAARTIRTNLLFMAPDHPYRALLVTSASPSEGKTTVACCIAIAMAQAGQRVVIVDCDLRRPRLHRIFGQSSNTGLTTALIDGEYDRVVFETEVPSLSVVPCGPVPPNPAELFHSDRFKALLAHLRKRFDRVIIDSPPVVAVTDPTILSTLVDGTVLVARAFATRKDTARHAARSLRGVGGTIAGSVLNAVDFKRLEYKYSYYYYRREGYYGSPEPISEEREPISVDPEAEQPTAH